MTAIDFPETNVIFAENQPEYLPLPAYKHGDKQGSVTMCFELSAEEIASILRTGKIWMTVLTFNEPLLPIGLSTRSPFDMPPPEGGN